MTALIKMSLKLLLRNKGFQFFLIVTPAISALILSVKMDHAVYSDTQDKEVVLELKDYTKKAVYIGDTSACIIKVYDASNSELSDYVLSQLAETGMFSICRADVSGLAEKTIEEAAKKDAFDDRAGMLLYLKKDFDRAALTGNWKQGMKLYDVSDDERQEIFITELTETLAEVKQAQSFAGNGTAAGKQAQSPTDNDTAKGKQAQSSTGDDIAAILRILADKKDRLPEKKVINLAGKDKPLLTDQQLNQRTQIGYAFAIITLGFLFCGVCVAHSVIEEQNNKVFTRFMLTKLRSRDYFISKFVIAFIISIMQTLVLAACLFLIPGLDVGISILSFLFVIFLLGLIFSTLSLLLGVALGDIMSSNYAVFTIWSLSALLAGLYFPLDNTTKALKTLSYLMPQKWFLDAMELLLTGDKSAYSMVLCATAAYLIIIVSVGGVALKAKRYE